MSRLREASALPWLVKDGERVWHLYAGVPDQQLADRKAAEAAMAFVDVISTGALDRDPGHRPARADARPVQDRDRLRMRADRLLAVQCFRPPSTGRATAVLAGAVGRVDHRLLEGFDYATTPINFTAIAANPPTAPALISNVVILKPALSPPPLSPTATRRPSKS